LGAGSFTPHVERISEEENTPYLPHIVSYRSKKNKLETL
jgi:hypothetical protein